VDDWLHGVRAAFPYRQGRVYLNSAGAGLSWSGAAPAAAAHYDEIAALGSDAQQLWIRRAATVRHRVAQMLAVPIEDVNFFRNTSEVINLAANSVDWRAGDEVVVASDDFPSVVWPWVRAEAAGGTVVRVEVADEHTREQRLLDALSPRTRVLATTHVNAVTGTQVDLGRLGRACREVGALLVVDGIEALGAVPLDLSYVDVYGAAVFKWMLSGFGTSIGVFGERARTMLTPAYRGYRNKPPSTSFEYADPNYPGLYVLDATMRYLEGIGWPRIYERVAALTAQVADVITGLGIEPVTPAAARAGIVSFAVPDAPGLVARLRDRGVDVVDKVGLVRVSPHFYNNGEDVERFAEELREALVVSGGTA
jgi:selenocysteine lyase/cysteine desulfurase